MSNRPSFILRALLPGLACIALIGTGSEAYGQCANNNSLLGSAITPPCPGITTVPCITAGQYALVNVTLGNVYSFSTCGAAWDTQITIFNNTGGASLGYNDDSGACPAIGPSYLAWTATFTGQLRVLVDQFSCTSNSLCASLIITCGTTAVAANDGCATAALLTVNQTCTPQMFSSISTNTYSGAPTPTCGGGGFFGTTFNTTTCKDVWFKFVAPANGIVIIETMPGTMTDAAMEVVSGTCASLSNVACDDESGVGHMPKLDFRCGALTPNATYYIRLWGYGGTSGTFGICVRGFANFPTPQEDCGGGNTICGSAPITNQVDYVGCSNDLNGTNRGCLMGNERQGSWYFFTPTVAGTASLTIAPVGGSVDYDFAIWGPMSTIACPPTGPPVRCSWAYPPNVPGYPAAAAFNTGMRPASVDLTENQLGDGFVAPLNLVVGQIYVMYIDNFDVTGQSFNLNWSFSGGASLDCSTLPVELLSLEATTREPVINVTWATATEQNSDHFTVERSPDDMNFSALGNVAAAGNAQYRNDYLFTDNEPYQGANYYRLKQVDQNGQFERTHTVVAFMGGAGSRPVIFPNPATDMLNVAFASPLDGSAMIDVQDAVGRIVSQSNVSVLRGEQTALMPTEKLAVGWYNLRIHMPDGSILQSAGFLKK